MRPTMSPTPSPLESANVSTSRQYTTASVYQRSDMDRYCPASPLPEHPSKRGDHEQDADHDAEQAYAGDVDPVSREQVHHPSMVALFTASSRPPAGPPPPGRGRA